MDDLVKKNQQLEQTLADLFKKAEENQQILQRFYELEQRLLSCTCIDQLLKMFVYDCKLHFDVDSANVILFDPDHTARDLMSNSCSLLENGRLRFTEDLLDLQSHYGQDLRPVVGPVSAIDVGKIFPSAVKLSTSVNLSTSANLSQALKSCILLPLVRNNAMIGSFHMASNAEDRYTQNMASDFMLHLASIMAVCLENCINQETLRRLCMIDMLTRVGNRRAFETDMEKEISRASRRGTPLSCLFLDLDHFKQVNDSYGHITGDRTLRSVAQEVGNQLRQTDLLARYGGEEFAALLPDCDHSLAHQIAERIRSEISKISNRSEQGKPFSITLSVGISTWYPCSAIKYTPQQIAHDLLACADRAVYLAKERGRNSVVYLALEEGLLV